MDAATEILVRRFSPTNTLRQPVFSFNPDSGLLAGPLESSHASGWLIDNECVISGAKRAIFFEDDEEYISIGDRVFRIRDEGFRLAHKKGFFISKLMISDLLGSASITYITPWWRYLWDDGSHTDLQFALEYFSRQWLEKSRRRVASM
ncbi:hypothetical protein [Solilutibacter pythonis]|uniref:hypothetical protein n=1 Tax=Solilutibacter pythonis TaxID=2483112 RepID=UPI001B88035C|nr:hypothetical protein [Lysobacter pythonis]